MRGLRAELAAEGHDQQPCVSQLVVRRMGFDQHDRFDLFALSQDGNTRLI
jgi:hypothetical protein